MNIEKLIQTVSYILKKNKGSLNYTKLIKLLYLSDRKSFEKTGYSISGDTYVSMKNGVVLSLLYDLIKGKCKDKPLQYYWNSKFTKDGFDLKQVCNFISKDELSDSDTEILDEIEKQYHKKSYSEMIDIIHNVCTEWQDTDSSIPLSKRSILENVGYSKDDIDILMEEEESYQAENELIESLDYPVACQA